MNPTPDTNPTLIPDLPADLPRVGDDKLYLKIINVGLGDCSYIILPNGKRVLIDCGTSRKAGVTVDDIKNSLDPALGILPAFDIVVLTHPDKDHYSLLGDVFGNTSIGELVHSMDLSKFGLYKFRTWYWGVKRSTAANIDATRQVTVNAGSPGEIELIDGGRGIKLFVVAANVPFPGHNAAMETNTASVVVVARNTNNGNNIFMIAADATCTTEEFMLGGGRVGRIQNLNVIRVAHHGSDTSSKQTFVDATSPGYAAFISSSKDNGRFCLPKESVIDRWLDKLPATTTDVTIGYWKDGAGIECRAATSDEEEFDSDPDDIDLPYDYGEATTKRRLYETFINGTRVLVWGPY